jgi:hypothetical protein
MMEKVAQYLAPYVPLLQTLLWVGLIVLAIVLFYRPLRRLIDTLCSRVRHGSSFKAGPVELGEDVRALEYASPSMDTASAEPPAGSHESTDRAIERNGIYEQNRGLFLTHVLSPSSKPGQKYDIFIYLIRHKTTELSDVEYAEFFFGHMWGNEIFKEKQKKAMIGVSTSAYGPFLCTCHVHMKDGKVIKLSRYIDFEMGRLFK